MRISKKVASGAIILMLLAVAGIATAYCGPGFSSKSSAVAYYGTQEGKARVPTMTRTLRAWGFMEQDQSFDSFIRSDEVQYVITPEGYTLKRNTYCPTPTSVAPYAGRLVHSKRGVLAKMVKRTVKKGKVTRAQTGNKITYRQTVTTTKMWRPFMKDYCRNLVDGKPFPKTSRKVRSWTRTDVCKNIPGDQPTVPSGKVVKDGNCIAPPQVCKDSSATNYGGPLPCKYPPPPVNPPIAQTPGVAHTYTNGDVAVFLKVKPATGHDVTVQAKATKGNVSGIQDSATYAFESCPSGWKCYKATYWASSTPEMVTVTWTVTQDDGQKAVVFGDVEVIADEF